MVLESLYLEKMECKQFLKKLLEVQSLGDVRCYFVGGCVRDRLTDHVPFDYDLAVDGDLMRLLKALQGSYDLNPSILGTSKIRFGHYQVDLATFRRERYVKGNGLPEIEAGDIDSDLYRRDFTINTGYVQLTLDNLEKMFSNDAGASFECAYAHPKFHEDIENGILRVLNEQSFKDDPSRLLRAVKYSTLYHLKMEDATRILFEEAVSRNVLDTYSKDRYRQIILGYAKHVKGIQILVNLFNTDLLLEMETSDSVRIHQYAERLRTSVDGCLFLLLIYETRLDFWFGADRTLSEPAKACKAFKAIVMETPEVQWLSRWWCFLTFRLLDQSTLSFIRFAVSIPEFVKLALRIYIDETQFIRLNINGHTLKALGVTSGKSIGDLLNLLLAYKVNTGCNMTPEEEIKWIESKRYEY